MPGRQPVCQRAHSRKVSGLTMVSPNAEQSFLGLKAVWLGEGVLWAVSVLVWTLLMSPGLYEDTHLILLHLHRKKNLENAHRKTLC